MSKFQSTISTVAALVSIFGAAAAGWKLAQPNPDVSPNSLDQKIEQLEQKIQENSVGVSVEQSQQTNTEQSSNIQDAQDQQQVQITPKQQILPLSPTPPTPPPPVPAGEFE